MKKKLFVPFTIKMALSFVALFVWTATENAAEPETPIIDVHLGLSYFDHPKGESQKPLFTSLVRCTFTRGKWLIEVMSERPKTSNYSLYNENSGSYVLNTTRFYDHNYDEETISAVTEMGFVLATEPIPNDPKQVLVTPGEHSLSNEGEVNIPWLAYCSARFLADRYHLLPLPYPHGLVTDKLFAFGYDVKVERFNDGESLPKRVEFIASKKRMLKSPSNPNILRFQENAGARFYPESPLSDGFIRAVYSVQRSTNILSITLPLEFRYQQFEELKDGKSKSQFEYVGVANKVETVSAVREVLQEPGNYYYIDRRFRHDRKLVNSIFYNHDSRTPPPVSSARLQKIFQEEVSKSPHDPAARLPFYRFLIWLAILMIFPIWHICKVLERSKQKVGTKQNDR